MVREAIAAGEDPIQVTKSVFVARSIQSAMAAKHIYAVMLVGGPARVRQALDRETDFTMSVLLELGWTHPNLTVTAGDQS